MTYSNTYTFNLNVEEAIQEAFERCGLEVLGGYDLKTARRSLNIMLSEWSNRGLNLWTIDYNFLTMVPGQNYYGIPVDVLDILDATVTTTALGTGNLEGDSNTTDVAITKISQTDYMNLTRKEQSSVGDARPTQFVLIPGQVIVDGNSQSGRPQFDMTLFLYPSPNIAYKFKYFYIRRVMDAGVYTNDIDVPFNFIPCLTAGLAYYIAIKRAPAMVPILKQIYDEEFERAADTDRERVAFQVNPAQAYIP